MIIELKKEIKNYILKYGIYVVEFFIFYFLFVISPVVGDRWNESTVQEGFESIYNFVYYMSTWIGMYNARVFSMCYSYIVDYNQIIRAIANAACLTGMSLMLAQECAKEKTKAKPLFVLLPFAVSSGIYIEVYFYATTLYISTICIFYLVLLFFEKRRFEKLNNKGILVNAFLLLVASMWLENLSLCLVIYFASFLFREYVKNKNISWILLLDFGVTVFGFSIMFFSNKFASFGRNVDASALTLENVMSNVLKFSQDNWLILAILSLSLLIFLAKREKTFVKIVSVLFFGVFLLIHFLFGIINISRIISGNIEEIVYYKDIYNWNSFSNAFFEAFFSKFSKVYFYLGILIYILAIVILVAIIVKYCECRGHLLSLLLCFCATVSIHILGIYSGYRVYSLSIFILFWFIGYFWENRTKTPFVSTVLFFWVSVVLMDQVIFIHSQKNIENERCAILNEVKYQQGQGTWNYDVSVVLPAYRVDVEGKSMGYYSVDYEKNCAIDLLTEISNPSEDNVRYDFLCHYYGISRETHIEYR